MAPDITPGCGSSSLRRRWRGAAAALLLCGFAWSASAQEKPDASDDTGESLGTLEKMLAGRSAAIHVDLAELGTGAHACDVTRLIRQQCDAHQRCEIEVDKGLCPNHPLPGMIQPLKVTYRCRLGEAPREAIAEEAHQLRILCDKYHERPD
jgi:hypothetical protein